MAGTASKIVIDKPRALNAQFIDNIPVGIYRSTLEGKIVFCNKAMARLFGFDSVSDLIDYRIIDLYLYKKDRGNFVSLVIEGGLVEDLPLQFVKRDKTPIWCAVTARAVLDDDGIVIYFDGIMREIKVDFGENVTTADLHDIADKIVFHIDLKGNILDINQAGAKSFGFHRNELIGKPLDEYIVPRYRNQFRLFVSGILDSENDNGILTIMDKSRKIHYLEFQSSLVKKTEKAHYLETVAWDVTKKLRHQKELAREKFQGVLEMAGGVAHNLNQPLMIINNLLDELLTVLKPDDPNYNIIERINGQTEKLNQIAKKIGGIKKYRAMEYVGGERIVDIDKTS